MPKILELNPDVGSEKAFQNAVLNHKGLALVVYCADGNQGCKLYRPVLESFAGKMREKVSIVMVNIDLHPDLVKKHRIRAVPDTKLYKDGKRIHSWGRAVSLGELQKRVGKELLARIPAISPERPATASPTNVIPMQPRLQRA